MALELQHFVYSLYPKQGYGITASTPRIDQDEWKGFCEPLPVEFSEVKKLGRVWMLRRSKDNVVVSLFNSGAKDEYDREGLFSHNIIISIRDYLRVGGSPITFAKYLVQDLPKPRELPPLSLSIEELSATHDFGELSRVDSGTLTKILSLVIKGDSLTLICPQRDTSKMLSFVSALFQLLPPSARLVSFVTASPTRDFRNEKGDLFKLRLLTPHSPSLFHEANEIDIDQRLEFRMPATPEDKSAHYLIQEFERQGEKGLQEVHQLWERVKGEAPDLLSQAENFVAAFEVKRGMVSLEALKVTSRKDATQERKRYAMSMLEEHAWRNPEDLVQIFTLLLGDRLPETMEPEIQRFMSEIRNLEPAQKLNLVNRIVSAFSPKIGNTLFPKLRQLYGVSFLRDIKDLSLYPAISSRLLSGDNYDSFQSTSIQVLEGAGADSSVFDVSLRYIMDIGRGQFGENTLDFTQRILENFPGYKSVIVQQLQKEDLLPLSVKSHLSKDMRQRLLEQAEKIMQVLKSVCSP